MNLNQEELLSRLRSMNGHQFEELVADIWEAQGWKTTVTSGSGDDGIDVIVEKDSPFNPDQKHIIQAKCYSNTSVGGSAIRNFRGAMDLVNDADAGVFLTTSSFSSSARETADRVNMKLSLVDGTDLCKMIVEIENTREVLTGYIELSPQSLRADSTSSEPARNESDERSQRERADQLQKVAEQNPSAVQVSELQALLSSSSRYVRARATVALAYVAEEYPEDARLAADDLQRLLTDEDSEVRQSAAKALWGVAEEYPKDVRSAVANLQQLLTDENAELRMNAVHALICVADPYLEDVRPAVPDLQQLLTDENVRVRGPAALLLAGVADEYPEDVRPAVPDLQQHLTDENVGVGKYATLLLAGVADEYPEDVRTAIADLQRLRTNESRIVCSRAIQALKDVGELD